jgi:hypothetical protein
MSSYVRKHHLDYLTTEELLEMAKFEPSPVLSHVLVRREFVRNLVLQRDEEARKVAARRGIQLRPTDLHVLVRRSGNQDVLVEDCAVCGVKHFHGASSDLSMKVAHCIKVWSPYRKYGYVTVEDC